MEGLLTPLLHLPLPPLSLLGLWLAGRHPAFAYGVVFTKDVSPPHTPFQAFVRLQTRSGLSRMLS